MICSLLCAVAISASTSGYDIPKGLNLVDETIPYKPIHILQGKKVNSEQGLYVEQLYFLQMVALNPAGLDHKLSWMNRRQQVKILKNGKIINLSKHNLHIKPDVYFMDRDEE